MFEPTHFGQPRLRPLNMKYPILATVRQISGQMTMSISSTRFLLAVFACRVKTKCSWSRLVRLSSWCITWRWPLDMFITCIGDKAPNLKCQIKICTKECVTLRYAQPTHAFMVRFTINTNRNSNILNNRTTCIKNYAMSRVHIHSI